MYEATNPSFIGETLVYNSYQISVALTGRVDGTYYYRVRACNGPSCAAFRTGGNGTVVTLPLPIPSSITVPTSATNGNYTISWGAASGSVTAYELYESTSSTFVTQTRVFNQAGLSFAATGRTAGSYYYRVRACGGSGCSDYRTGANGITVPPTTPPTVPSGVTATVIGDNRVDVSWNASTDNSGLGLAGYQVYRGGALIATVTTTSFSDTTVSPFNTYSYSIIAYDNASNYSGMSSAATAVTSRQITDSNGNVLSTASSLYMVTATCPQPTACIWYVRKKYGDQNSVVSVQSTTSPACASGTSGTVAGYQRSGCVLRAAPSKYGQ